MDGKRHIITIAAIGPDSGQTLTLGVYDALRQADALLLRTGRHGVADRLRQEGVAFETLDALYDRTEDFDELCELAARAIIDRARQAQTLIYAVSEPQSDATVRALVQALPDDMALRVLSGVTLTDAAACAAIPFGVNTENLRTVTALSTAEMRVQADCPQVVTEIDNRYLASDVKLWLGDLFDDGLFSGKRRRTGRDGQADRALRTGQAGPLRPPNRRACAENQRIRQKPRIL